MHPDEENMDTRSERTLEYDIKFHEVFMSMGLEFDSSKEGEGAHTFVKCLNASFDDSLRRTRPAVGDVVIAINGESVVSEV